MNEELLKGLSQEQITKIKSCKSQEELLKLAKDEGVELTNEQLAAVSGGDCGVSNSDVCPICSNNSCTLSKTEQMPDGAMRCTYYCRFCNKYYYHETKNR